MTSRTRSSATAALVAVLAGAAVLTLTACAGIEQTLGHRHEESFATYAEAEKGWVGVDIPAWIPDDASTLHNNATNDETVSVIRVNTDSPLVGDCTQQDRHGLPALEADWSTDEWPDTVTVCGDYEIMPVEGGWLGWLAPPVE